MGEVGAGADFNPRARFHHRPDLVDLFVGDGDAAVGRILTAAVDCRSIVTGHRAREIRRHHPLQHPTMGTVAIRWTGISNVQGFVQLAVGNPSIDRVNSLGCFLVFLAAFGAEGWTVESHWLGLHDSRSIHPRHGSSAFFDEKAIDLLGRFRRRALCEAESASSEQNKEKQHSLRTLRLPKQMHSRRTGFIRG